MTRLDVIVVPGINPEPWRVGPASAVRRGRHLGAFIAPDPALTGYQEAMREEFRALRVPLLDPPYQLRFWWWRKIETYRGPKRMVTKNAVDQTNLQKATEDALQPAKEGKNRTQFDGIITNDRHCVFSGGWIMEQSKEAEPLIVVEILSRAADATFSAGITDLALGLIDRAILSGTSLHGSQEIP